MSRSRLQMKSFKLTLEAIMKSKSHKLIIIQLIQKGLKDNAIFNLKITMSNLNKLDRTNKFSFKKTHNL